MQKCKKIEKQKQWKQNNFEKPRKWKRKQLEKIQKNEKNKKLETKYFWNNSNKKKKEF